MQRRACRGAVDALTATRAPVRPCLRHAFAGLYAPSYPLPTYYPTTVNLAPGQFAPIAITAEAYGLEAFPAPHMNVNCDIPPGVEMNLVGYDYSEPPVS